MRPSPTASPPPGSASSTPLRAPRPWVTAGIAGLLLVTMLVVDRSGAGFSSVTASTGNSAASDQLSPASGLVATRGCTALPSTRWIALSWTASPSSAVTQYTVYRSTNGGAFSSVHTTTGTSWTNSGLSSSTTYAYYVVAERGGTTWVAAASNTASQTTHGICV